VALRSLSRQLVVVFDEFQRLRHCPGDPLSIIRSALMSSGANHVSLLFTGSIRNALKMMLEDSGQPIFGEATRMQLPIIERVDFLERALASRQPPAELPRTRTPVTFS